MVCKNDILDAVNISLVTSFPEVIVYRDAIPKEFQRPSFFIRVERWDVTDINYCTISVKNEILIQCIDEVDDHYEASTDRLHEISDKVISIFNPGYLSVLDRALKVSSLKSSRDGDVYNIKVTFDYFDDRGIQEDDTPVASDINLNLKEE